MINKNYRGRVLIDRVEIRLKCLYQGQGAYLILSTVYWAISINFFEI